jgi:hypothetical protein
MRLMFIAGLGAGAVWPVAALGQRAMMPVIGFLRALSTTRRKLRSTLGPEYCSEMNCGSNAYIGRAATEICQLPADVLVGRMRVLGQQVCRRHDHPGLAIAALGDVEIDPSFLNWMIAVRGQALDRRYAFSLGYADRHDAGSSRSILDMHRAGPASPDTAPELASR